MTYDESIKFLNGLHGLGIKLGLERTERLLSTLDNPQNAYPSVIIGGTNGKGSVAAMTASILKSAGLKTGLYTSPHLERVNERIRIDGDDISDDELAALVEKVREKTAGLGPTYFEFLTVMAFEYFRQKAIDVAVLEVGMGGRLDSTNVVTPLVSVITTVALDHEYMLGNTLKEIASEKAGIIKQGVPVVTGVEEGEALEAIERVAAEKNANLIRIGQDFTFEETERGEFNYNGARIKASSLKTLLIGRHQITNAAIALATVESLAASGMDISERAVRDGLLGARWPGRLEVMNQSPIVLLDCAHNPAGAKTLAEAFFEFDYRKLILVFGCMSDKDASGMLSFLLPHADRIIFTRADNERSAGPDSLLRLSGEYASRALIVPTVPEAVKTALSTASADDLVCIAGSVYVVGEARRILSR